jgi:hypothetical protein
MCATMGACFRSARIADREHEFPAHASAERWHDRLENCRFTSAAVAASSQDTKLPRKRERPAVHHDGRFSTLESVPNHYGHHFKLNLTDVQKRELIACLKSM